MLTYHIITLFPEMFDSYLNESILKRAIEKKKIAVKFYNPRYFAKPSKNPELLEPIDDKPFGGGVGMVLKAEFYLKALEKAIGKKKNFKIIYFSPRGENFTTDYGKKIAKKNLEKKITDLILVTARYEGFDSRVEEIFEGDRISIGDYVLTGGELPAMILIDSISRQLDGVLGNKESLEEERISAGKFYTRPASLKWKKKIYNVPKVLLSGNHKKIEEWKKNNS